MGRPRLRVKTGCLTCRRRRKRCDEQKPVCGDCHRLQLPCTWPLPTLEEAPATIPTTVKGTEKLLSKPLSPALPLRQYTRPVLPAPKIQSPAPSGALSNGYKQFRNGLEYRLFTQTSGLLSMMICPIADDSCYQLSQFLCASLQESWSRDAITAFTASFFASHDDQLALTATELYQSAVVGLKSNILDNGSTARRQMLIVASNSLGLIETLCSGDEVKAIHHFVAVGQLLSMEVAGRRPPRDLPSLTLYRVVAECVIFNIGSLALFYPRLDRLAPVIDWFSFETFFEQDTGLVESPYRNSPFLGGRRDIYRVMFAISWLSQRANDPSVDLTQYLRILDYEILQLQHSLLLYYGLDVPIRARTLYTIKYQLHIFAMQINVMKIAHPEICSSYRGISELVSQSLALLQSGKLDEEYNPSLCWPLTVLLCAAREHSDFVALVDRVVILQKMVGAGHATRMGKIIVRLSGLHTPSGSPCPAEADGNLECDGKHDGLNLLLQKGGLT